MQTRFDFRLRRASGWALGLGLGWVLALGGPLAAIPPHAATAAASAVKPAATSAPVAPGIAIVDLKIEPQPDSTVLRVASRPHPPAYRSFYLRHPDRWVLDLQDSRDALPRAHWKVLNAGITDVRAAQFEPNVVRIVLDLNEPVHPHVMAEGGRLRIAVASVPMFAAAPSPKKAMTMPPSPAKAAPVAAAPAARVPTPAQPRVMDLAAPPAPKPVPVAAPVKAVAPAALPVNKTVMATRAAEHFVPKPAAPVPVAAPAPPPAAQPASTPRGQTPPSLLQPLVGTTPGTGEPTVYTGEKITLNLKNADLTDFFRLINQISGLNIIVDPAVKGTVTMVLQQVPWDQALDIVLRNNDLGRKLEGNVLYIATMKTLQQQNQEIADLKKSRAAAAPFVDKVMPLSYAKADDVAKVLTTKGFILGENEMVTTDSRTNALILHVHPDTLPAVDALVARLDRKTPQVEIEARVVAASRSFVRDLGVQFGVGAGNRSSAVGGVNAVGSGQTVSGIANPKYPLTATGSLLPLNVNLGASAPTSGLAFINASSTFRLDAILSAAESKGLGHILSRPKVITQNNMQAMVQQGVRIPVQTTINNTISVQFFNVTLRLTVTPQITADNTIFMNVDVENDAIDNGIPPVNGIPAIDTQQATTNVLVANGGTVVIGGVMINNNQNNVFQVPLLGSLPVIGNLFKRQQVNNTSQELLFFITPRIVPG